LNERIGKWAFWFLIIGFCLAFFPMYITGLDGQARRMYTYSAETGYGPLNFVSTIGAVCMAFSYVLIVYMIYYSIRHNGRKQVSHDPWDARNLEWATHNPVPDYNFAKIPQVNSREPFWDAKQKGLDLFKGDYQEIHMPNNSGVPFIMSCFFFVFGFALVFSMWYIAIFALIGIFACMAHRSFEIDHGHHISVKEIKETEAKLGGEGK